MNPEVKHLEQEVESPAVKSPEKYTSKDLFEGRERGKSETNLERLNFLLKRGELLSISDGTEVVQWKDTEDGKNTTREIKELLEIGDPEIEDFRQDERERRKAIGQYGQHAWEKTKRIHEDKTSVDKVMDEILAIPFEMPSQPKEKTAREIAQEAESQNPSQSKKPWWKIW